MTHRYPLYTVSLDLGQARDYSALAVIEQSVFFGAKTLWEYPFGNVATGWSSPAGLRPDQLKIAIETSKDPWPEKPPLHVRHLERFPLGTRYPAIVKRVGELMKSLDSDGSTASLVLDLTGVGRPVWDVFREAGMKPSGISIHGGDAVTRDGHGFRVPKRDLVSVVSTGLQSRRLQIAASLELAEVLAKELQSFKVTIDPQTAHDSYAAWREKDHDDLVLSVAMGCWFRDRHWRQHDAQMRQWRERATLAVAG